MNSSSKTLFGTFAEKALGVPERCAFRIWLKWRVGQLLGINNHVGWPVHWQSTIILPRRVQLGRGTCPGDSPNCYLNAQNGIIIGDFCNLGPGVGLISANHDYYDNTQHLPARPIRLGAYCWLGMNAIILPGVELGPHTIVAAGAIVTKSFPEGYCIIGGNPAKVIRKLDKSRFSAKNHE
ncbi:MAG: acyltransferase [Sumerlaeia bacterium]